MRTVILALLFLIFAVSFSLSNEDNEDVPSKIKALETELSRIQGEPTDLPAEELSKASQWIEDSKRSLNSGNPERTRAILEKASYQIEFLEVLADESKAKKEIDGIKELLQKIRTQTEEIKATNARVTEEINRLEQK
jgi:peptidoglycan hydrolase CwlO-like protein